MNCPHCQAPLPENAKFCLECGGSLASRASAREPAPLGANSLSIGNQRTLVPQGGGNVADAALAGTALETRYELDAEIGRGGFATVWRARDRRLDRIVAVKRLLANSATDGATIERFRREARMIAGLNHQNIVAVYDHDCDTGGDYIVMEYIGGGNLRDYLKSVGGKLPPVEAARLVRGIAQGLACAHRRNLVHRDVKPANILLAKDEAGTLVPKLVDFGLARVGADSNLSMTGYGMGTPWYMPPEQRRDAKNVNHTADIYALGKVLYELLTGDVPDNVHPGKIPPPPALAALIFKCVESKPEDRYFSIDDLLRDLEAAIPQDSVSRAASNRLDGKSPPPLPQSTLPGLPPSEELPGRQVHGRFACSACGAGNADDARFCIGCGGGLFLACPECGCDNPASIKFCPACGTDIPAFQRLADAVTKMTQYNREQKWSRTKKEIEILAESPPFKPRGEKGKKLAAEVANLITAARQGEQAAVIEAEEIANKKRIEKERQERVAEQRHHLAVAQTQNDVAAIAAIASTLLLFTPEASASDRQAWQQVLNKASVQLAVDAARNHAETVANTRDFIRLHKALRDLAALCAPNSELVSVPLSTALTPFVRQEEARPTTISDWYTLAARAAEQAQARLVRQRWIKLGSATTILLVVLLCGWGWRAHQRTAAFRLECRAGLIAMQAADYPTAIWKFEKALEIKPSSTSATASLVEARKELAQQQPASALLAPAIAAQEKKEWKAVRIAAQAALALAPDYADAKKALDLAEKTLEQVAAHLAAATAAREKEKWKTMWAEAQSALKLEPTNSDARELRNVASHHLRIIPDGFKEAALTANGSYTDDGWAREIVHEKTGMAFCYIPAGRFAMGSPLTEEGRNSDEALHLVNLSQGFYIGKYEVTQAQWEALMGNNPSYFKGGNLPVEQVSWDDCQGFLGKLGSGFRLPTEAEWEYACRAGTTGAYAGDLDAMAWYGSSINGTHSIGQKSPNAWGLHDMHGNVFEWCADWYGAYPTDAVTDPQGASYGSSRVYRGGGWNGSSHNCRSAIRDYNAPSGRINARLGFRVAFVPQEQ